MQYITDNIRRKDRIMDEARAKELLKIAEYGVLSMISVNGYITEAYGIPINFVWDGSASLYLHCAPEGRKLKAIAANPNVSFCIVGKAHLLPDKFTTEYESVILSGLAHTGLSEEERRTALRLFVEKFCPNSTNSESYINKSFNRVEVIRLDISSFSGKSKNLR